MGVLTKDMQRVVREGGGFVATIRADRAPDLAPAGTLTVWDDDHLVLMEDMFLRGSVANLLRTPAIEVIVIDPVTYRAYRFGGRARILDRGPVFNRIRAFFRDRYGAGDELARVRRVGLVKVQRASPLAWPIYDAGASEREVPRYVEYHGPARRRVTRGKADPEPRPRS